MHGHRKGETFPDVRHTALVVVLGRSLRWSGKQNIQIPSLIASRRNIQLAMTADTLDNAQDAHFLRHLPSANVHVAASMRAIGIV